MNDDKRPRSGEGAIVDADGRLSDAGFHFPILAADLPDLAAKRVLGRELGLTDELIDQLLADED
jgi:hypothetical protein